MFNTNSCPKCGNEFYIPTEIIQNPMVICPHCKKNVKNPAIKKGRTFAVVLLVGIFLFFLYYSSNSQNNSSSEVSSKNYVTANGYSDSYIINTNTYGATDKKAMDDLYKYLSNNDISALNQAISSGEIIEIPVGTKVNVVKNNFSYTVVKIVGTTQDVYVVTDHLSVQKE